jgi:hypothetical protein
VDPPLITKGTVKSLTETIGQARRMESYEYL